MWDSARIAAAVERGKREIVADAERGRVPWDVPTFASLHDHVDANEYAGLCDDDVDPEFAPINEIQDALAQWIEAGGLIGRA